MKLFKGKFGYQTICYCKKQDGTEVKRYLDAGFKKGSEPIVDEMDGKLIFRTSYGEEYDCFFTAYAKKDGTVEPKLMMLPSGNKKETHESGPKLEISPDDLPFY